ncbi:YrhK family protein [Devosia rhodophyticola]|uniref:YrhK family protein n=1 Tax=Devosia rhodophyticola TaxID=3026423 RepID=A0ABY7YXN4_9HYPH|nr:YrhK family protein [Devosia rhodophyticola]WDR05987.1 YrhK family protein [Devosia rhodophyticola]
MVIFQQDSATNTPQQRRLYAIYELFYTLVDAMAAILFLIGSVLFFYDSLQTPAIWLFVCGSACFALKPVLRVVREFHLLALGDIDSLADRYQ